MEDMEVNSNSSSLKDGQSGRKGSGKRFEAKAFSATKVRSSAPSSKSLLLGNVVVE